MEGKEKNIYKELSKINVNDKIEKKKNLTYLSWTYAFDLVLKKYPNMTYNVLKFENNLPYVFDENTGYMVFTNITIEGETKEMFLPVMDGANKAMKNKPYKYNTKYGEKEVNQATMFDINKTIMRCLVKNLAMFGLGIYIYAGEDLPTTKEPKKVDDEFFKEKQDEFKNYYKKVGKDEFFELYSVSETVKKLLDEQ